METPSSGSEAEASSDEWSAPDGICSMAEELERKGSQLCSEALSSWSRFMDHVHTELQLSNSDIRKRRDLVQYVDALVKRQVPGSFITPFGSYAMALSTPSSDLDLSLSSSSGQQGNPPKEYQISILRRLRRALQRTSAGFIGVEAVLRAAVPVIKFQDCRSGIECDLSVGNEDGIVKSSILALVGRIDQRFGKLCYLVKAWAKAQHVNDSRTGSPNSFTWILLVALHLQTRSPPILPPFSDLLEGFHFPTDASLDRVQNRIEQLDRFGKNNRETIPQLFGSFFTKLVAVESLWERGLCASTWEGKWVHRIWRNNIGCVCVEDFLDRNTNVARAVQRKEMKRLSHVLRITINMLKTPKEDINSVGVRLFGMAHEDRKRPLQQPLPEARQKRVREDFSRRGDAPGWPSSNRQTLPAPQDGGGWAYNRVREDFSRRGDATDWPSSIRQTLPDPQDGGGWGHSGRQAVGVLVQNVNQATCRPMARNWADEAASVPNQAYAVRPQGGAFMPHPFAPPFYQGSNSTRHLTHRNPDPGFCGRPLRGRRR